MSRERFGQEPAAPGRAGQMAELTKCDFEMCQIESSSIWCAAQLFEGYYGRAAARRQPQCVSWRMLGMAEPPCERPRAVTT